MKFNNYKGENFEFQIYNGGNDEEWDDSVFKKSVNGTFLQSRRFISYHPKNKLMRELV